MTPRFEYYGMHICRHWMRLGQAIVQGTDLTMSRTSKHSKINGHQYFCSTAGSEDVPCCKTWCNSCSQCVLSSDGARIGSIHLFFSDPGSFGPGSKPPELPTSLVYCSCHLRFLEAQPINPEPLAGSVFRGGEW